MAHESPEVQGLAQRQGSALHYTANQASMLTMQSLWWQALLCGYLVSLVGGGIFVRCFDWIMKHVLPCDAPAETARWKWLGCISSDITGLLERLAFTALVFAQPEGAITAMGGWLALKMAATWNRDIEIKESKGSTPIRDKKLLWASQAFLALQSGFVSMAFAGAGGALARHFLGLDK